MMIHDVEQGSDEWLKLRLGKVTASRVADVCATTRTGWGASRANYMAQLIAERLTGTPERGYVSPAMQWGTDHEAEARAAYEFYQDAECKLVGFVDHPSVSMSGASPDAFIGKAGLADFKCPLTATHIETLLGAPIPDKYLKQLYWQMACTGRDWGDYVSFDPRLPPSMQLYVQRVLRDDKAIADLEVIVDVFLLELDAKERRLRSLYEMSEAA